MPASPPQNPRPHATRMDIPAALQVLVSEGFASYRLLDSGGGRKLEQFGEVLVDRPEPQALWMRRLPDAEWRKAQAVFAGEAGKNDPDAESERGRWSFQGQPPASWLVPVTAGGIGGINAVCQFGNFWHLGMFPEQHAHWKWMLGELKPAGEAPRLLNLFAYTGVASLLAAAAGAQVTHVDASKKAIAWAKENQAKSSANTSSVRWILDDARKFAERELRRGRTYHGILIDPPKFGRGPGGEVWDLFSDLAPLLRTCAQLLAPERAFLILTSYAIRASALSLYTLTEEVLAGRTGLLTTGELAIRESDAGRALATSLFTRWTSHD